MEDTRSHFKDALKAFRKFASDNDRPTDFLWISQDRVRVVGCRIWIFRPDEIQGDERAENFYEVARSGESSIKLLGICSLEDRYLTCVERMPAPPHTPYQLYMSLHEKPSYPIVVVTNRLLWNLLSLIPSFSKKNGCIRDGLSLRRTMKTGCEFGSEFP